MEADVDGDVCDVDDGDVDDGDDDEGVGEQVGLGESVALASGAPTVAAIVDAVTLAGEAGSCVANGGVDSGAGGVDDALGVNAGSCACPSGNCDIIWINRSISL